MGNENIYTVYRYSCTPSDKKIRVNIKGIYKSLEDAEIRMHNLLQIDADFLAEYNSLSGYYCGYAIKKGYFGVIYE